MDKYHVKTALKRLYSAKPMDFSMVDIPEMQFLAADWLGQADALLFGRRTYNNFSRDWPRITDLDDPFTEKMNGLPKYVASRSLKTADLAPTTILSGDIAVQVSEPKQESGRELQIHGSATLAQSLLAAGLLDELRLVIAPVVLGNGR